MVSILFAAADAAKLGLDAIKYVGAAEAVMARFSARPLTAEGLDGFVLEAKEGENTVQIFNRYQDGRPQPLFTESAVEDMREATAEQGGKAAAGSWEWRRC